MNVKMCSHCHQIYPLSAFKRRGSKSELLTKQCEKCRTSARLAMVREQEEKDELRRMRDGAYRKALIKLKNQYPGTFVILYTEELEAQEADNT